MSGSSGGFRLRGVASYSAAILAGRLAQAAAFFVMARVLDTQDMAIVALLTLIYTGLFQLTNLGFEKYVIYSKDSSPNEFDASVDVVWSMQLTRGVVVLVAAALIAMVLIATGKYDLGFSHFMAISAAVILLSLINPGLSAFERAGNFAVLARVRGLAAIASAIASIAVVLLWKTPWAYVVGQLVNAALVSALSFHFVPRRPQLSYDMKGWKRVFRYCKHMLVIAAVSFVSAQAQNFYVAAALTPAILSSYFVWYRLITLPGELVTQLSTTVLFAAASDGARKGVSTADAHLRSLTFICVFLIPFHTYLWFHGDFLISLIAGDQYADYWWAGRLMLLANFCLLLAGTVGPFMLVHLPHVSSTLRSLEALASVALIIVLGGLYQDTGVLLAVLAVMAVALTLRIVILYLWLLTHGRVRHMVSAVKILGVVALPIFGLEALLALGAINSGQPLLAALGYSAIASLLIFLTLRRRGALFKGQT